MAPTTPDSPRPDPVTFVLNVVASLGEIKVNWEQVARESKISYARNAFSKFKETAKKNGFKFESNKLVKDTAAPPQISQPENTNAGSAAFAGQQSTGKRKAVVIIDDEDGDDDGDDDEHLTKKQKVTHGESDSTNNQGDDFDGLFNTFTDHDDHDGYDDLFNTFVNYDAQA